MPYVSHPDCVTPDMDSKIWRYLDFPQFISILERESLFFNRSDNFSDPFEGAIPHQAEIFRRDALKDVSPEWFESLLPNFRKAVRNLTYLNCWHINNVESAAMWDLYLKTNDGICIQSTFGRLVRALEPSEMDVMAGSVQYIDYSTDKTADRDPASPLGNTISPFLHKRESFAHERELRAIVQDFPWEDESGEVTIDKDVLRDTTSLQTNRNTGHYVKVDLEELVDSIRVAPAAPAWIKELLGQVLETYSMNKEIKTSSMETQPKF